MFFKSIKFSLFFVGYKFACVITPNEQTNIAIIIKKNMRSRIISCIMTSLGPSDLNTRDTCINRTYHTTKSILRIILLNRKRVKLTRCFLIFSQKPLTWATSYFKKFLKSYEFTATEFVAIMACPLSFSVLSQN
jgi:hypothetical protein